MPKHNWLANCCLFVDIQNKLNSGFALTEVSPETCTSNSQNYDVCVTKHGQALVRILGATDEVKQFDKPRKRVKDFPGHHFYRQQYSYLSAVMETRISRAEREVRHQLKSWEQQQLAKMGEVSTTKDMLADRWQTNGERKSLFDHDPASMKFTYDYARFEASPRKEKYTKRLFSGPPKHKRIQTN